MLCAYHKPIIAALNEAQRSAKRERNALNAGAAPGKNVGMSRLNASISWRRCVLMQVMMLEQIARLRDDIECGACRLTCTIGYDVFRNCLPSSMAERFFRKEEVVSSSLADGSISTDGATSRTKSGEAEKRSRGASMSERSIVDVIQERMDRVLQPDADGNVIIEYVDYPTYGSPSGHAGTARTERINVRELNNKLLRNTELIYRNTKEIDKRLDPAK